MDVPALIHQAGYGVVFGVVGLEAMGLPLPGATVLLSAAVYGAATHRLAPVALAGAATAGAVLGATAGYAIGRFVGAPLLARYGARVFLSPGRLLLGRYLIRRHGAAMVVAGRFVAVLRALVALIAGASGMGFWRFTLFNAVGTALWAGALCAGASWLGPAVLHAARPVAGLAIAGAVGVTAWGMWFLRRHERRLTGLAEATEGKARGSAPMLEKRGPR